MNDFPQCWRRKEITIEVEAKELAVVKLLTELVQHARKPVHRKA